MKLLLSTLTALAFVILATASDAGLGLDNLFPWIPHEMDDQDDFVQATVEEFNATVADSGIRLDKLSLFDSQQQLAGRIYRFQFTATSLTVSFSALELS